MVDAIVIAALVVGVLACPVMMLLGRRGIGPGCALGACAPRRDEEPSLDELRRRERELSVRIAQVEAERPMPSPDARTAR